MKIKLSGGYIIAFLALTILCGTSHEFVHHFTGWAICGCFGYKTFNSFELCAGCEDLHPMYYWATIAGPLFTFLLMWIGFFQMRTNDPKKIGLGFALVFANFPINRIMFSFMGMNDEQYVASLLFPGSPIAKWAVIILILLITVPPLVMAYKIIRNKHKILWFIGFFILPFVFVFLFAGFFLESFLLLQNKVLADTVIGIPYLILVVEVVSMLLYMIFKKYLYKQ